MAKYERSKWHSGLTYRQVCGECNTEIVYTDEKLGFRMWFPDGFVYCPKCRTPLRHSEEYAIDRKDAPAEEPVAAPVVEAPAVKAPVATPVVETPVVAPVAAPVVETPVVAPVAAPVAQVPAVEESVVVPTQVPVEEVVPVQPVVTEEKPPVEAQPAPIPAPAAAAPISVFCHQCGNKYLEGDRFCILCGAKRR